MPDPAFVAAMRAEKVRILWDYQVRQYEMHERRYLQLMAASLGGGLATLASVLLETLPRDAGLVFASVLFLAAAYFHTLIRRLPRELKAQMVELLKLVERLMLGEDY